MHTLKSRKAAGLDSIIHELWLAIETVLEEQIENEKESFNIMDVLTIVFNDIQKYGMELNTGFANGWLCPLYKKGDKMDIKNY